MKTNAHLELIRSNMMDGDGKEEQVEVNQRHLIDKILARYSAEYVLYRELMQNSDDATSTAVQINFHSVSPSSDLSKPPNLSAKCDKITFRNNGIPFRPEDWSRLKRIAEGNPDEQKIGAFGVGFYSLFSVCENPFVFSGSQCMAFYFKGDQLFAKRAEVSPAEQEDWTSFLMDLREPMEMPDLDDFARFLTTSMGFTTNLREISVYFDQRKIFNITKRMAEPREMTIHAKNLHTSSPQQMFTLTRASVRQVQLEAEKYATPGLFTPFANLISKSVPQSLNDFGLPIKNATIFLRVVEGSLAVNVTGQYEREMERATKKKPPKTTKFQLVYTGRDELDVSENNSDIFKDLIPFPEQGRIFIGFPTHQTTGCCSHMAARFIPTVERESIDFADRYISVWNKELLAMGGLLSRLVYDDEMETIDRLYKELVGYEHAVDKLKIEEKVDSARLMLQKRASHVLYSFTFQNSTPNAIVGKGHEERFFNSSKMPICLMTSHGIQSVSTSRILSDCTLNGGVSDNSLDMLLNTFVKTIPTLMPIMVKECNKSIKKLVSLSLLKSLGISDVFKELNTRALNVDEMVGCMKWWIECNKWTIKSGEGNLDEATCARFLDAAILDCGDGKLLPLSHIKWWINPKIIPLDMPVPDNTLPFSVSKTLSPPDLQNFFGKLRELSLLEWSSHIVHENELETSPVFAERILTVISRGYSHISVKMQANICSLLKRKQCIPTKYGMKLPEESYFPTVNLFDDLPLIQFQNARLVGEQFLTGLGIRKHVNLQLVFDRLISDGSWSHIELVKYLTTVQSTLSAVETRRLCETPIFTKEGEEPKTKKYERSTGQMDRHGAPIKETYTKSVHRRYRASELFAPTEAFRNMQLPLIYWDTRWRSSSDEAKFLEKLGLWFSPPLSEILRLASPVTNDRQLQNRALGYLIDNYKDYERTYDASKIDVKFLPCSDGETYASPKDCYTNPDVRILGFLVLHADLISVRDKLGVRENPSAENLVKAFLSNIDKDYGKSMAIFEYMASRMSDLGQVHWHTLRQANSIPVIDQLSAKNNQKQQPAVIFVQPSQCYFEADESSFFKELFPYVNFGPLANSFLRSCGVKDEPTTVELTSMIVKNPSRFWNLSGGGERYLTVLRRIASQFHQLKSHRSLLADMKTAPFLVGLKKGNVTEMPTTSENDNDEETPTKEDYVQYRLAKASDIFIVDDTVAQQIFSPLSAPMDTALEDFYANLGSDRLSKQVKVTFTYDEALGATTRTKSISETIFERIPIIVYQMMNDNLQRQKSLIHDEKYAKKHLKVIQVKQLKIIREFKHTKERHVQPSTACADKTSFTIYVSSAKDIDYYDIANALCVLLFTRVGFNDAIVVERYLTASLNNLRRKGVPVDRILHIRKNIDASLVSAPVDPLPTPPPAISSDQMDQYTKRVREVFGDCQEGYIRQLIAQERENHVENVINKLLQEDYPRAHQVTESTKESAVQATKSASEARESQRGTRILDRLWSWGGVKQPAQTPNTTSLSQQTMATTETASQSQPTQKSKLPNSEKTITPNYTSNIKQNLKRAIHSCKAYSGQDVFSPPRINKVVESNNYCDATPGHNLMYAGQIMGMEFYVHRGIQPEDVFTQYGQAIKRFTSVAATLAEVFSLKPASMHIFYDQSGSTIAFNLNGSLFLNLRYYLALHELDSVADEITVNAKRKEALIYWFMTTCHELAHNFISDHSSEHEFYMSSFAEVYLDSLIDHLPTTGGLPGTLESSK